VSGVWARVGPAALKQREKHGVPELYANFEALAAKQGGIRDELAADMLAVLLRADARDRRKARNPAR